ncbi:MAG: hypothetical protein EAZ51_06520 [Sphingobacteriales bacterium]|nr:MAG: hypothetical protein EAZ64_00105 [Sphingobacteriales bacterium]TAF80151.1 MAG: hypothetical protein EAZ51_06520 [Sphingobacteriales bacterium]
MGSLKTYDKNLSTESIASQRAQVFLGISTEKKLQLLFNLNRNVVVLNRGKPLKKPQEKGIIIKKNKICFLITECKNKL